MGSQCIVAQQVAPNLPPSRFTQRITTYLHDPCVAAHLGSKLVFGSEQSSALMDSFVVQKRTETCLHAA